LQWVVTGYALTFGSLLLVGGRLADLLGRRRLLAIGLIVFAVASLACGLARWPVMLIAARLVQGGGGALVSPAALSMLTTTNAEGAARNRALAIWQATAAGGATAGIVAGGLLTQYLGWRAVFLVNPPLIALMLALIRRPPAGAATGGSRIDYRGAILVTAAIASLIFGLTNGQQHGFTAPVTVAALVLAVLLGVTFVRTELTATAPMLPLSIFSAPARRAAVAAMVMIGAVLAGYVYFVSLYLQRIHHFSPVSTGLALLPSTATGADVDARDPAAAGAGVGPVGPAGRARVHRRRPAVAGADFGQRDVPGRGPARPHPHLAWHRPGPAHRVDRDHQRRPPAGSGASRSVVHHQPADRGRRRPGRARHGSRRAHGPRRWVSGRRVPAVVSHLRRDHLARRGAGRGPASPQRPAGGRGRP
jgi:MFS family permease